MLIATILISLAEIANPPEVHILNLTRRPELWVGKPVIVCGDFAKNDEIVLWFSGADSFEGIYIDSGVRRVRHRSVIQQGKTCLEERFERKDGLTAEQSRKLPFNVITDSPNGTYILRKLK